MESTLVGIARGMGCYFWSLWVIHLLFLCVMVAVLLVCGRMMQHYLVLGLELNLYAVPEELEAVFWYLDYLACSRLHQMKLLREHKMKMNAIKQMIEEEERNKKEGPSSSAGGGGGGGKKKRKKSKGGGKKKSGAASANDSKEEEEDVEDELRSVRDNIELNIERALAKGLHYFLAGVRRAALDPTLTPSAAVKTSTWVSYSCGLGEEGECDFMGWAIHDACAGVATLIGWQLRTRSSCNGLTGSITVSRRLERCNNRLWCRPPTTLRWAEEGDLWHVVDGCVRVHQLRGVVVAGALTLLGVVVDVTNGVRLDQLTDYSDLAVDFLLHRANEFFKVSKGRLCSQANGRRRRRRNDGHWR